MTAADQPQAVPRVTVLDRWILRGRDPGRPVALLRFERLRWALLGAVLLAVVGAGLISWAGQSKAHDVCVERNRAGVAYREALDGLAQAAAERGDARSAAIFRSLQPRTGLPDC